MTSFTFKTLIFIVFFFSGAASLIYQVAWQRALTLHYGVGSVSTAIVVSIFLLGLGLGSLAGGWLAEKVKQRIFLYFVIEIAIGLCGLASLLIFGDFLPKLANMSLLGGFFLISFILILPTLLMGITLPLVLKILNEIGQDAGHSLSLLYFVNTLGAAFGALIGAYGLISFYGIAGAVKWAAYTNFALAGIVLLALIIHTAGRNNIQKAIKPMPQIASIGFSKDWHNYAAVFTTGFIAIGYQMIWFRILTVLLKPSAYVFSTVLAVYLFGIALGSLFMSMRIKKLHSKGNHKNTFFKINALIAIFTVITIAALYWGHGVGPVGWMLETTFNQQLHPPYHPMYAIKGETFAEKWPTIFLMWDVFIWPAIIVLPTTILMGASFPLISAMAIEASKTEAWKAGTVYVVNIIGNVLGALITGFILFPILGTELTLMLFTIIGLLWILGITKFGKFEGSLKRNGIITVILIVAAIVILPKRAEFYLKIHPATGYPDRTLTESVDGVVLVYHDKSKPEKQQASVYINGAPHARFPAAAYRGEVLETARFARNVEDVLVIGFGGGDLTYTMMQVEGVKSVTVVEISEALTKNLREIEFYKEIFANPKLNYVVEDGRRFLHTTDKKFDVVLMDPLRSTSAYSNNIYSQEFFELIESRLKPDGVIMTWMNEYKVIPNTLASVFDYMHCKYYFCISSNSELIANDERADALWNTFDPVMQNAIDKRRNLKHYYKGDRDKIIELGKGAAINTDLCPSTEYYIGHNLKRYFRLKNLPCEQMK